MNDQHLGAIVMEALRLRDRMRADGTPEEECKAFLERTIRSSWPFTREWKYVCANCRDCGLVIERCPGDATCGRSKEHLPHEFGTACWCQLGQKFKPKAQRAVDELAEAAKSRPLTRWGR